MQVKMPTKTIAPVRPPKKKRKEKWKLITNVNNNWYSVSQLGRIRINKVNRKYDDGHRRYSKVRVIPHIPNAKRSPTVKLQFSSGEKKIFSVMELVGEHWLQPYNPKLPVKHKNPKSRIDCSIYNIYQENMETNRRLKLSDEEVISIRKEYLDTNILQKELAARYNVSVMNINDIIKGNRRRNIDDSSPHRRRNVQIECIRRDTGTINEKVKVDVSLAKPSTWRNPPRPDNSSEGDQ
jgi:hypothetical protein